MIRYRSTRGARGDASFSEAIVRGLAPDRGLYVPSAWPSLNAVSIPNAPLSAAAAAVLRPFLASDALEPFLEPIVAKAFDFPAPLKSLESRNRLSVLELFHGPTAAFKDFGARFLAACLTRFPERSQRLCILVATSGDTGGAVAAAFHNTPGVDVVVLYPEGRVSPLQEQQLTCWGDNVRAFAVRGSFDDCQRLVKAAFESAEIARHRSLSSANSINLGRLLPQMTYFAAASLSVWRQAGERASFIVPSGNLGHATACIWAKHVGLPIGRIVLAHNANRTFPDFLDSGVWTPSASLTTPASAMDVGDPSNAERLRDLFPNIESLRTALSAASVESEAIAPRIRGDFERYGEVWCPHTAVAAEAYARLSERERAESRWVLVATAHPAKFREIVEPAIGQSVALPDSLAAIMALPSKREQLPADVETLASVLMR
ncbi:MAG: threonine synthase [Proteobacteria bacterium]|nr:threonine synthase [Pseudomonadota bacterium]